MRAFQPIAVTADILTSSVPEDEPSWLVGTNYTLDATVRGIGVNAHKLYVSLQTPNTGHEPGVTASAAFWLETGATNRMRMFDEAVGSQTFRAENISVSVSVDERVTALVLANIDAATAHVTVTDPADGVVFDREYVLTDDSAITDWYAYFYEPINRATELIELGLPNYAGADIAITLAGPGSTVRCGACLIGRAQDLGATQWGPTLGIQDFSVKERDAFGNFRLRERAYSRTGTFDLLVDAGFVDRLQTVLAAWRATPVVYIGDEDYGSTVIFGFFTDLTTVIAWPDVSLCNLRLESLI